MRQKRGRRRSARKDVYKRQRISCNEIDLLLYFRDPMQKQALEPHDKNLLRLCDLNNIPVATNIATAEVLIHGLERGDLDWREIVKL